MMSCMQAIFNAPYHFWLLGMGEVLRLASRLNIDSGDLQLSKRAEMLG